MRPKGKLKRKMGKLETHVANKNDGSDDHITLVDWANGYPTQSGYLI